MHFPFPGNILWFYTIVDTSSEQYIQTLEGAWHTPSIILLILPIIIVSEYKVDSVFN
jgi:hypothetical protein